ncbi:TPA: TetR/AcrR family transcriptional regulator [Methanosarcina acetivorans]|jgi:AcrR family transcriptional regulator|uniref:Transcriptional regulator, TetR family n=2 Tax=Methanosarcina acetivorans TaxID=2214 RepID=Q8TTR2_METAC|nr:TetR/AcrR family transcriptional regulator [Methanosarcina acetivorans]AAM03816.1 transcriptional regulator, TetR family [Methanosarcina acetivorans C2A]HIH93325.1 TetR/AcrR family transcriptional regulator [Methanosarcina acetivorans]
MARVTKTVEERHQEIIDTAKALFMENGFDKTQISDIAKRMNVAQGLVYHYFKSKTEMLYAVIDELAEEKQKEMETVMNRTESTALEKLTMLLSFKMNSDNFGKLMPSISSDVAIIEYCSIKKAAVAMPILLSLIKQGNSDGSWNCDYPEESALFILRGLSGFSDSTDDLAVKTEKEQILIHIIFKVLGLPSN